CKAINSIEDYYDANRRALFVTGHAYTGSMTEVAEGVWVGNKASISHRAYIVGPVIIGDGGTIEENVQIIGPSVIGNNCLIGKRAFIRESVLLDGCEMEEDSGLKYCIAGGGVNVCSGDVFENKIVVENLRLGDLNLVPSRYQFRGVTEALKLNFGSFKYRAFLFIKRLMDVLASSALLVVLSPVMLVICAMIKRDSEGPCVFSQKRCGKDGKDFVMYKFRTMVKNAPSLQQNLAAGKNVDGPMFKLFNDPRVTRIGEKLRKTSLDELPQLINVLRGEMSLVGPRPLVMDEMRFSPSWRSIRLKVKPGVTGLWQVQGRSEASFHDWIRYDVYYVKKQSLWLDLTVLLKTIKVVFKKVGAY
ncbi:MAG: sugar transferase, partial [Deltaproteobacteria bacterium]